MLEASRLSFDKGDSSEFIKIFSKAVTPYGEKWIDINKLNILTSDDLSIGVPAHYDYYGYNEQEESEVYNEIYKAKINKMDAEKVISDAKTILKHR